VHGREGSCGAPAGRADRAGGVLSARVVPDGEDGRHAAIEALRAGGIVAIPTDTVYGIAVGLDTAGGVERLFVVKERPEEKAVMVLVDGLDQVAGLVELPPAANVLSRYWPGGLTLVLPLVTRNVLPAALTAGLATLGVRVPDHPTPRALAQVVGPLPATSANLSGRPDSRSAEDVVAAIGDRIDLVVDGGPSAGGTPSTVVDCSVERPRILRAGALPVATLAAALDEAGVRHDLEPDS
jgi:L-threonylcarbamoyladenylate synthase